MKDSSCLPPSQSVHSIIKKAYLAVPDVFNLSLPPIVTNGHRSLFSGNYVSSSQFDVASPLAHKEITRRRRIFRFSPRSWFNSKSVAYSSEEATLKDQMTIPAGFAWRSIGVRSPHASIMQLHSPPTLR
uniref:Ovule protein n=1 Tax=Caenorhabditis tropicalis TaxID=1561998 RepID=A0A1I7U0G0_9PELO